VNVDEPAVMNREPESTGWIVVFLSPELDRQGLYDFSTVEVGTFRAVPTWLLMLRESNEIHRHQDTKVSPTVTRSQNGELVPSSNRARLLAMQKPILIVWEFGIYSLIVVMGRNIWVAR